MESEMMDASLVRAVLADAGVSGELLEGLTEGCVEVTWISPKGTPGIMSVTFDTANGPVEI